MLLRFTGLFALVFVFSASISEASMIDSFDAGTQSLFVSSSLQNANQQANPGTGTSIGGYRDVSLEWLSGVLEFASVSVSGTQGLFVFSQLTADSSGRAAITWDGADSPNSRSYDLGENLTSGNNDTFLIDVNATTGSGMDLILTVYTDATHASEKSITLANGFSGLVPVSYNSFSQVGSAGAADFTNVGAIVLDFDGEMHSGSNIVLNSIQTVPEPSTLLMLAFGAMAFLGVGRRWKLA